MDVNKFDLMCEKMITELDKDYSLLNEDVTNTGVDETSSEDSREKLINNLRRKRNDAINKASGVNNKVETMATMKKAGMPTNDKTVKTLKKLHQDAVIDREDAINDVRKIKASQKENVLEEDISDSDIFLFANEFEADLSEDLQSNVLKKRITLNKERQLNNLNAKLDKATDDGKAIVDQNKVAKDDLKQRQMMEKQEQEVERANDLQDQMKQAEKKKDENTEKKNEIKDQMDKVKNQSENQIKQVERLSAANNGGEAMMNENIILENKASRLAKKHEKNDKKWQKTQDNISKANVKLNKLEQKKDVLKKKLDYVSAKGGAFANSKAKHIGDKLAKLNVKIQQAKSKIDVDNIKFEKLDDEKANIEFKQDTLKESLDFNLNLVLNEADCISSELDTLIEEADEIIDELPENNEPVDYKQDEVDVLDKKKKEILSKEYDDTILKSLANKIKNETDREKLAILIIKFNDYAK